MMNVETIVGLVLVCVSIALIISFMIVIHTILDASNEAISDLDAEVKRVSYMGTGTLNGCVDSSSVISLEEGVHRLTGLAAKRMAIRDRGELRCGANADITVFDIERVNDNTTSTSPNIYPSGIEYVMVNGQISIDAGKRTIENAGVVLRAS